MSTWRTLLDTAIQADPRGIAGVAETLGVSRAALSLVANGKYPAKPDRIAARIVAIYDRHDCPHLAEQISRAQCRAYATRSAPTNSPRDMRHWRACHGCPNQPQE